MIDELQARAMAQEMKQAIREGDEDQVAAIAELPTFLQMCEEFEITVGKVIELLRAQVDSEPG